MLISDDYRRIQTEMHRNSNYGVASMSYAPLVAEVIQAINAAELLDYGAGKGRLALALKEIISPMPKVRHYDPAIPEWSMRPEPCDVVACIDVLEHIEPELLENVLDDLRRVTVGIGVFTVATIPAAKTLPDGRNAHLIVQSHQWWLPKILDRFDLNNFAREAGGFWITIQRKDENLMT
jgi:2-polyprenyl-3-methyl-5-hydroxy-6-metoxy-1,4-benzoquinol methylase